MDDTTPRRDRLELSEPAPVARQSDDDGRVETPPPISVADGGTPVEARRCRRKNSSS